MDKIYNVYIEFNDDDPDVFPQDIGYFSTEEKAKQAVEKAKEIAAELFKDKQEEYELIEQTYFNIQYYPIEIDLFDWSEQSKEFKI